MIFKLLDAYETEIRNRKSFLQKMSDMSLRYKLIFAFVILITIAMLLIIFIQKRALVSVVCAGVYYIFLFVITQILNSCHRKNYMKRAKNYNKRLEELKILLEKEEFNINSENKLLALIKKINLYIEDENKNENKRIDANEKFTSNITLPIITFGIGTYMSSFSANQVFVLALFGLLIAIYFKFIIGQYIEIFKSIFEPTSIKMKFFVDELQDVYDRYYLE